MVTLSATHPMVCALAYCLPITQLAGTQRPLPGKDRDDGHADRNSRRCRCDGAATLQLGSLGTRRRTRGAELRHARGLGRGGGAGLGRRHGQLRARAGQNPRRRQPHASHALHDRRRRRQRSGPATRARSDRRRLHDLTARHGQHPHRRALPHPRRRQDVQRLSRPRTCSRPAPRRTRSWGWSKASPLEECCSTLPD